MLFFRQGKHFSFVIKLELPDCVSVTFSDLEQDFQLFHYTGAQVFSARMRESWVSAIYEPGPGWRKQHIFPLRNASEPMPPAKRKSGSVAAETPGEESLDSPQHLVQPRPPSQVAPWPPRDLGIGRKTGPWLSHFELLRQNTTALVF